MTTVEPDTRLVEWVAAIGTVGAVVVALLLASLPAFRRWRRRPRLELRVGNTEPHLRVIRSGVAGRPGGIGVDAIRVRVQVHNRGRSEARRVRVQVLTFASLDPHGNWVSYDIDPIPLAWVGGPNTDDLRLTDLATMMSDLVEVADFAYNNGKVVLLPGDRRPREFDLEAQHIFTDYWLEVAAAAENADVVIFGFYFSTSKEQLVDNVREGNPPATDKTLRGGLLSILAREYAAEAKPPWWRRLLPKSKKP